jgi:hypothetical protein
MVTRLAALLPVVVVLELAAVAVVLGRLALQIRPVLAGLVVAAQI